jgi:hypothetical protein
MLLFTRRVNWLLRCNIMSSGSGFSVCSQTLGSLSRWLEKTPSQAMPKKPLFLDRMDL